MKFKMQDKQNQLIERISDNHLVVGVDIAQQLHVARAVNFRGIVVGDPLAFENNEDGFASLLKWMEKLQRLNKLEAAIVGMEPTGHYWINLSKWLFKQGIEVVTVNPHLVKRNKENRDNTQSKSDKKDALVIADMVKNGYYAFVRNTSESFEILRVLMSNRDVVVKRLVSTINQLNRWVDIVFPELRQVFKDITGKGAIATLRLFPSPMELRSLKLHDVVSGWKSIMKRQPGLKKAQLLLQLARKSVGTRQALEAYKFHLEQLLEEYDLAVLQLERVEQEVKDVLKQIPFAKKLLAIKGISEISLAGILGEAGDLSGFSHGNSLLRHAGLHLAEASSGKWKGQIVISKRGRSRLRRFLYLATMSLVMNNTEFRAIHTHNVKVKKMKKMKSIMKLVGKLARIFVGIARRNESYCADKVQPITELVA
ncbi:IS110 family transposase [Peribacillus frigoritolerans]|uniref:IS110 family transposase n=1 Tax=Peribacillus frigoritolerans TaxID=450367 RepID=UPI0024C133E2|nr:IS110 family transposase [Peribacillus frigoritolerans]MDM5304020.1 IS110 family transposase [Peribacillus frigoritolerans]MDM5309784.1 IS110 family transposase [Peribacillus frigoritolerans]MDM5309915.1 IS110 family transposase [Peribacillus frigoritolerans]MDM5311225.1 IS110 family transposase [Peribacillus frigoritolerans]MDM5311245.1 IS110 family transposase [Peribacillus frigoritolerans]